MSNPLYFDTNLLELLPPWYREIYEYQWICEAESQQFELLAQAVTAVADNLFFQTMDAASVSLWETIYKIIPDLAVETLDFRRARIINRISTRPPFTVWFLRQKLDELIGENQWTLTVDYPNYTIYIESSARNQNYATEVAVTIGKIKPAHIVYYNTPYTSSGLLLSETISQARTRWNYRLGAWGLGLSPFADEEDLGVIKVAATPSIQAELLSGVANFVSGDIASARVNGTIAISNLTKTVSGNVAIITYPVTAADTTQVTSLELLDSDGNVLTQTSVYVPISETSIMKHVIPVEEGVSE